MEQHKRFIIITLALAVVLVFGYRAFSVYLQKQKEESVIKAQLQKEQAVLSQQAREREQRMEDVESCIRDAAFVHSSRWASACENYARTLAAQYESCKKDMGFTRTCESIYQPMIQSLLKSVEAKGSANCSLPSKIADGVNEEHEADKAECYRKYGL